jgi:BlaI family transcriptional regulator, penicillinase repressor
MPEKHLLTELQLAIVRLLWAREEATVTELWEALYAERQLAQTTLATILSRLERRGVVAHRTRARQFIYRALVSAEEVQHSMVNELTAHLFEGDVPALVNYLLTAEDISPGDLARIREMLDAAEQSKEVAK